MATYKELYLAGTHPGKYFFDENKYYRYRQAVSDYGYDQRPFPRKSHSSTYRHSSAKLYKRNHWNKKYNEIFYRSYHNPSIPSFLNYLCIKYNKEYHKAYGKYRKRSKCYRKGFHAKAIRACFLLPFYKLFSLTCRALP